MEEGVFEYDPEIKSQRPSSVPTLDLSWLDDWNILKPHPNPKPPLVTPAPAGKGFVGPAPDPHPAESDNAFCWT